MTVQMSKFLVKAVRLENNHLIKFTVYNLCYKCFLKMSISTTKTEWGPRSLLWALLLPRLVGLEGGKPGVRLCGIQLETVSWNLFPSRLWDLQQKAVTWGSGHKVLESAMLRGHWTARVLLGCELLMLLQKTGGKERARNGLRAKRPGPQSPFKIGF